MFLADLPRNHPLRNKPLAGFFHRWHCWKGGDITESKRGPGWAWWGASPWKLIPAPRPNRNPMTPANMTFNELEDVGGFWTRNGDWAVEKLPARTPGELQPPFPVSLCCGVEFDLGRLPNDPAEPICRNCKEICQTTKI